MANMNTPKTLGELFFKAPAAIADEIAIEQKKGNEYVPYSYRRLLNRAARLGSVLAGKLPRGAHVMIVGKNSFEWVVSYLAVTCFVGAAVALPDAASPETAKNAAKLCDVSLVLYGEDEKALADATGVEAIPFSEIETLIKGIKKVARPAFDTNDIAELVYSYGSDECAKAVILTHKNICFTISEMEKLYPLDKEDKLYSVLPAAYSFERICGTLYPLSVGATVTYGEGLLHLSTNLRIVRPTAMLCVPLILDRIYGKIWANIEKKGIGEKVRRAIKLTEAAGVMRTIVRRRVFAEIHDSLGGKLSVIICAGLGSPDAVYGLREFGIRALCSYGMPECSALACANTKELHEYTSVGLPIPGGLVDVYNINSAGVGEIRCRGDNVTSGYYGDPERTGSAIRGGWFYTGDMGYFDRRGFLHIIGKKSNIIAVSKNRSVFPEEIEALICRNPFVSEALVYGEENGKSGSHDVVAAIYPNYANLTELYGPDMTHAQLRREIKAAIEIVNMDLDAYKRVVRFSLVDAPFEKNEIGKIVRATVES